MFVEARLARSHTARLVNRNVAERFSTRMRRMSLRIGSAEPRRERCDRQPRHRRSHAVHRSGVDQVAGVDARHELEQVHKRDELQHVVHDVDHGAESGRSVGEGAKRSQMSRCGSAGGRGGDEAMVSTYKAPPRSVPSGGVRSFAPRDAVREGQYAACTVYIDLMVEEVAV